MPSNDLRRTVSHACAAAARNRKMIADFAALAAGLIGWLSAASASAGPLLTSTAFQTNVKPGYSLIAVFGPDERTPLGQSRPDLAAKIGTLTSRKTGAVCSAFCLAPDLIATASHCIFGTTASAKPDPAQLQFRIGGSDEISILAGSKTGLLQHQIISGTRNLSVAPPIEAAKDWAVARLEQPICRAGGLAITAMLRTDIEAIAAQGGVYQVAIHRDLPSAELMLSGPCALPRTFPAADLDTIAHDFSEADRVLFHSCDTGGGSSGSPLLIDGAAGPEVVAINVGTYVLSRMVLRAGGEREAEKSEAIANTAVAAVQFADAAREMAARVLMTRQDELRRLEIKLQRAGLFSGSATGRLTAGLERAIQTFEIRSGLPATGLPRRALLSEIDLWVGAAPLIRTKLTR